MTNLETGSRRNDTTQAAAHKHAWCVESRHTTSEGQVLYVRCRGCGTQRVDVQHHRCLPPVPLSAELRRRGSTAAALGPTGAERKPLPGLAGFEATGRMASDPPHAQEP